MKLAKSVLAMSILLGIFIAPITFIPSVNAQEGQVVVFPTDDTYTDWELPESNFGYQTYLAMNYIESRNIWLKFNLADVPDGAIIDVATLELYATIVPEAFNVSAHQCFNNSWTELTLTYSNEWSLWGSMDFPSMDQTLITSPSEWFSWDVTDAVVNATDGIFGGEDVVTVVLVDWYQMHENNLEFSSKEAGAYIPKLTIHWIGIIPEFPTWISMLLVLTIIAIAVVVYKRRLLKISIH